MTTSDHGGTPDGRTSHPFTPLQRTAQVVGLVFLVVGVLGFVPGITEDVADLELAGHESEAMLFGIFQVSWLHNLVHLAFGAAGLLLSRSVRGAKGYLVGGGVAYLVLWLYGLLVAEDSAANFVPLNTADDWLHLVLGVGMVALGLLVPGRTVPARTTSPTTGRVR